MSTKSKEILSQHLISFEIAFNELIFTIYFCNHIANALNYIGKIKQIIRNTQTFQRFLYI